MRWKKPINIKQIMKAVGTLYLGMKESKLERCENLQEYSKLQNIKFNLLYKLIKIRDKYIAFSHTVSHSFY